MLDVTHIVAEIEKRAGHPDPELEFRPNMEHFVAALNSDNRLSALGLDSPEEVIAAVAEWRRRNPKGIFVAITTPNGETLMPHLGCCQCGAVTFRVTAD